MGFVGNKSSPNVIVVGNEKGGTGKTTVAMHLAIGLLRRGLCVATIDLDSHQRSLTRYLDNRRMWLEDSGEVLVMPRHRLMPISTLDSSVAAQAEQRQCLLDLIEECRDQVDIVVVDCPSGDGFPARLAHSLADSVITPVNDSFVDLDLLLQFRPGTFQVLGLGGYFQMLWEIRNERHLARRAGFDWIVLRNRLSSLADGNKKNVAYVLEKTAPILRFHLAQGLGERIIFRQLFCQGLTVFDMGEQGVNILPTHSHAAAREEIGALLEILSCRQCESIL